MMERASKERKIDALIQQHLQFSTILNIVNEYKNYTFLLLEIIHKLPGARLLIPGLPGSALRAHVELLGSFEPICIGPDKEILFA